jgi:hypothetical protein
MAGAVRVLLHLLSVLKLKPDRLNLTGKSLTTASLRRSRFDETISRLAQT